MRLWHKEFIHSLPKGQLVAQWRELSAIAGAIQKTGTPNHILVNFVLDYPFDHFISYTKLVRKEMTSRGYKTMDSVWNKIVTLKPDWKELPFEKIYPEKMDTVYKNICYMNLLEKYMCGGIPEADWKNIRKEWNDGSQ